MTETTITENKFTASVEIKTRLIADQIVTALEGGVGYWLESFKPVKGQERATTVQPWYDDEKVWASDFLIERNRVANVVEADTFGWRSG